MYMLFKIKCTKCDKTFEVDTNKPKHSFFFCPNCGSGYNDSVLTDVFDDFLWDISQFKFPNNAFAVSDVTIKENFGKSHE